MKTTHFIFLLFLGMIAQNAFAQLSPAKPYLLSVRERMQNKLHETIAQEKNLYPVKKTRASSRLIAQSSGFYNGITFDILDSFRYAYNSNYGYDPTPETFMTDYINDYLNYNQNDLYDSAHHYMSMGGPLTLGDSSINTFGTNHKLVNSNTDNFNFGYYETHHYQYNANEKKSVVTDSFYNNGNAYKFKYQFTYNGANKAVELKGLNWDGAAWIEEELDSLFYNGAGNLVMIRFYVYDSANAVWVADQQMSYTYTGANKVSQELSETWNGAGWTNDYKTEYLYDGSNRHVASNASMWDMGAWKNSTKDTFAYAAGNYPVNATHIAWDDVANAWLNEGKSDYTYNASGQLATALNHYWNPNNNNWEISGNATYYYGTFTAESVDDVNTLAADMQLYPVPSGDVLNIKVSLAEKQQTTISILDFSGRPVMANIANHEAAFHEVINIAALPAGHYMVLLKGAKGTRSSRFSK